MLFSTINQLFLLILCHLHVNADGNIEIFHGDAANTKTKIYSMDDNIIIETKQDGAINSVYNRFDGNRIDIFEPKFKTSKDEIVEKTHFIKKDGNAQYFRYSTSNGAAREERVKVSQIKDKAFLVMSGVSSYIDNDGYQYLSNYIADKNGYRSKVLFGTNVHITKTKQSHKYPGTYSLQVPTIGMGFGGSGGGKNDGIDGAVLCSLLGRGCI